MRSQYHFEITETQELERALWGSLIAYNEVHAPLWEQNHDALFTARLLQLFVLDAGGTLRGGLMDWTHRIRPWLEISTLWVQEAHRGQGLGRALMERAEEEARLRGCFYARLSTSQFQAPGYYEKVGYALYGKLADCPPGETSFYYRKNLHPKEAI